MCLIQVAQLIRSHQTCICFLFSITSCDAYERSRGKRVLWRLSLRFKVYSPYSSLPGSLQWRRSNHQNWIILQTSSVVKSLMRTSLISVARGCPHDWVMRSYLVSKHPWFSQTHPFKHTDFDYWFSDKQAGQWGSRWLFLRKKFSLRLLFVSCSFTLRFVQFTIADFYFEYLHFLVGQTLTCTIAYKWQCSFQILHAPLSKSCFPPSISEPPHQALKSLLSGSSSHFKVEFAHHSTFSLFWST